MTITYTLEKNLYINLTNRCLNKCPYCIKYKWKGKFYNNDLILKKEPSSDEVIEAIGDPGKYKEIVFCGYGEPLLRLEELMGTARWLKAKGCRVRLNTSGLANLHHGKNIVPGLKGLIDTVSISLNGANAEEYSKINCPDSGLLAFDEITKFIKECKKHLPLTVITAVALPGLDTDKVKEIADNLGVEFVLRPYLGDNIG